ASVRVYPLARAAALRFPAPPAHRPGHDAGNAPALVMRGSSGGLFRQVAIASAERLTAKLLDQLGDGRVVLPRAQQYTGTGPQLPTERREGRGRCRVAPYLQRD